MKMTQAWPPPGDWHKTGTEAGITKKSNTVITNVAAAAGQSVHTTTSLRPDITAKVQWLTGRKTPSYLPQHANNVKKKEKEKQQQACRIQLIFMTFGAD